MSETSARLLKLLSLLQTPREWTGTELAERLGVTTRTIRRDVERLRELGYPVHATRGTAGYRLGAGASLPPLLLDDEEAVAVVVGLRTAAGGSVAGLEEPSLRALTKLEQVLPSRLRYRVTTLHTATVRAGDEPGPRVAAETLMAVAEACRRRERLRFDYTDAHGAETVRTVEPQTLVSFGRRWYLVAFDLDRSEWRTFRVDRLRPRTPTGPRFEPRPLPYDDVATYVARQLSQAAWPGDGGAARIRHRRGRPGVAGHGSRRGRRRSQLPAARRRRQPMGAGLDDHLGRRGLHADQRAARGARCLAGTRAALSPRRRRPRRRIGRGRSTTAGSSVTPTTPTPTNETPLLADRRLTSPRSG